MARKTKALILDAWAALSFLDGGDAGKEVVNLIYDAHEEELPVYMSVLSAGEVFSIMSQTSSIQDAESVLDEFVQLGVQFVDVDFDMTKFASTQRIENGLEFIDGVVCALATQNRGVVVTGNSVFKPVEDIIKIHWLS